MNIKRSDDDYIGAEHPFPKEAPHHWRMAKMKALRREVKMKKLKEWKIMKKATNEWAWLIAILAVVCLVVVIIGLFTVVSLIN